MPLYSCAVESVLLESCPVTRSPSRARLHRQTVKPLSPHTCVVCLVGPTMALQAVPSPRRCDGSKDKKTKQTSVLDFATWDDMAVIFTACKACLKSLPESLQGKSQNSKQKRFPMDAQKSGPKSQIVQAQCQQVSGKSARTR